MAIHRRLTDKFDLIFLHDDALTSLPSEMVGQWHANGRNIEDLDLTQCTEAPTIFECIPLKTKHENLRDQVISGMSAACWQIFKHHVKGAKNCVDEDGRSLLKWTDNANPVIEDDCRENIPTDIVADIASVICGKAEEASAVFTLQASFWEIRARSRMRLAKDAESKTASAPE
jgi:hypothetical protein